MQIQDIETLPWNYKRKEVKMNGNAVYRLRGGFLRPTIVSFTHDSLHDKFRILHHHLTEEPEKFVERFSFIANGKDEWVDANTWYSREFAKRVWETFTAVQNRDQKFIPWTRID